MTKSEPVWSVSSLAFYNLPGLELFLLDLGLLLSLYIAWRIAGQMGSARRFLDVSSLGSARGVTLCSGRLDYLSTHGNARNDDALKIMRRPFSAALVLLSLWATCCYGDGGAIIARQTIGGLQLTVFASPAPVRAGPVDVSVLVQKGEKPILDASVDISWKANSASSADWLPPCCTMESPTEGIPALRGHSNNQVPLLRNRSHQGRRTVSA